MAGSFHYGEKEMRRRSRSLFKDPILWFYWFLSGYSEDASRAIIIVTFIWFGFAFLFSLQNQQSSSTLLSSFSSDLFHSLQLMTLQIKPTTILESIEAIIGPLQIGLMALAVRRRLNR